MYKKISVIILDTVINIKVCYLPLRPFDISTVFF